MICPTLPVVPELPPISTLSVGMYWTPSRTTPPPPLSSMVLLLAVQLLGSTGAAGGVGTKQSGSLSTSTEMRIGGVGESGPLVCTGLPDQSMAAVAASPPAKEAGNFVPAFRATVAPLVL